MKTNSNKAFYKIILLLFCFYGYGMYAGTPSGPSAPTQRGIIPPGEPIDTNIAILLVTAVLFGTYTIYKVNKKRPI